MAIEDPAVYAPQQENIDQGAAEFTVRDPQDFNGHIVYVCKGTDLQGPWECMRRYNEFFTLHDTLTKRWPGIVLPLVPPKKTMGNKDLVFLQERRFYLERFVRKLSHYEFIINSQEFQIFARPQGLDVEKSLNKLPKLSNSQLYDRLKEATMTDDTEITDQVRDMAETKLSEFMVYVKKSDPFLKKMKNDLGVYLTKKQQVMQNYANSANILTEYEENNVCYYTDRDPSKLVITSTGTG